EVPVGDVTRPGRPTFPRQTTAGVVLGTNGVDAPPAPGAGWFARSAADALHRRVDLLGRRRDSSGRSADGDEGDRGAGGALRVRIRSGCGFCAGCAGAAAGRLGGDPRRKWRASGTLPGTG